MTLNLFVAACLQAQSDLPFNVEHVTTFDEPWAIAFLPDGRMLVTEMKGNLFIVTREGQRSNAIGGVPDIPLGVRVAWAMLPCIRITATTASFT